MTRTRKPRKQTTRQRTPRLTKRGNLMIAINGKIIGGWRNLNPAYLQHTLDDFPAQCREVMQIEIDSEIAKDFMDDLFTSKREFDALDGILIAWWLSHNDPEWPRMMRELAGGIDFAFDLTKNKTGEPEVVVRRAPIH